MATERQAPDEILELTNLSGTVSEIQDDPDDPDSNWLDAQSNNADSVVRVSFPTPSGDPTEGEDLQEFRVLVRKYGGTGTPQARIELYENGIPIRAGDDVEVTGQMVLSFKWNANELYDSTGADVECKVYGTKSGGGPSARATIEVGAIEWNATYEGGAVKTASATLSGEGSLAAAARLTAAGKATLAGTGALAAKGSYLQLAAGTLAGTGALSAKGGLVQTASATLAGAGSVAASAFVTRAGAATMSGTGSLAVLAHKIATGKSTLSGTGSLAAAGTVEGGEVTGSAILSGIGALAAAAHVTRNASATLSGAGTLASVAHIIRSAAGAMAGAGTLATAAHVTRAGKATLSGEGTLSTGAVLIVVASATLSGQGMLSAGGVLIILATATISGTGMLTATAIVYGGLSPTLLAAQKSPHRLPYVEAKVYDYEAGIKRLSWTRLYEGSEPDNHHGLAFDGQGNMHRIRAAADDKLYRQKITSPGPSSDYSQWINIASDCAGPCAIAAYGAKVYIFYKTTANVLWKYYSHDYGQTWDDAQLVDYGGVLSLAACWWGTGNIVVCFALKSNQLNGVVLDTSDQTTTPHTWSDGNHPLLDTYGIGATYNPFWPAMEVVFAGKESDSPYNHYDLFRTKFSNTYNFLALESFLMSPDGEDITYEYPDCHLPASAQPHETNRILAVEKFAGTTAYTRPLTCHMVRGTYWSDTTFTEPKPFLPAEAPGVGGLRLQSTTDYWWMERPDGVWRAPRPAGSPLDLTKDIVSLQQNVPDLSGRGNLVIELNNSKGQYVPIPSGLRFRSEIVLKLGYKTTAGNETSEAGTYWIDSWEYSSKPNMSRFILTCLDGWGLMDRWTARYQMRWNKDEVNPKSVWQILYQLLARAGIKLTNIPPKPQSSTINNFYPDFTVGPGTQGTRALNKLLSFVPDRLVFRGQEAFTKNPLPAEESCYSYKFPSPSRGEGQGEGAIHAILSGKYTEAVTVSRGRAIGRDASGNRIIEEALDPDLSGLAIDILEQDYDPNLTTAARAQERADAILRTQQTQSTPATIVVPTNVGQELLDVVEVSDERCGISQEKYRIQAIQTDYDRRKSRYDQTLTLGAP